MTKSLETRVARGRGMSDLAVLALASLATVFALAACEADDEPQRGMSDGAAGKSQSDDGAGGAATPASAEPVECGSSSCEAVQLPLGYAPLPACCADVQTERCGLDASGLQGLGVAPDSGNGCEPRDQPGLLDASCPESAEIAVPNTAIEFTLQGCCRKDTSQCGYLIEKVLGLVDVGLGCVDAAPLLAGAEPTACVPSADSGSAGSGSGGGGTGGAASAGAGGTES